MSKIVKNIIALSVSSALSISFIHNVNAATYKIKNTGEASKLKYTYAQHQNSSGDMAISGTSLYNFPVQFQYLDEDDFTEIRNYALFSFASVHALNDIEDFDALKAGNPTANDLAWVVRWLQDTRTGKGLDIEYQKVGDTIAMTNVGGVTEDYNLWDETFDSTTDLTRSTIDIVSGITNGGISYGTATAPYLPEDVYIDSDGEEHTFWLREYGIRGFFSYDQGAQVHQVVPLETEYGGGESAVLDVNEAGIAVGFSSYKLTQAYIDVIEDDSGGCADPDVLKDLPFDACVAQAQLQSTVSVYHTMALKATLDPNDNPVVEQLGLLVEPHPDDERPHSSYALAVNADGVAVGYADGWDDETETSPSVSQSSLYHYAVVYKNGEVIDLSGDHANKASSRAYDINDAGIAVGHLTKAINGKVVQKFFYVDTTVPKTEIEMIYPDDFFAGSDSTVRAINNAGLMVGEGEIETHNESPQNPRRTAAFVYDMEAKAFSNLNKLIPCSERLTYDIIEARGINDTGMISATAIVKVARFDAKGIAIDGETEDVVRAISLELIPGGDDGEICTAEEEGKVIRKGAGFGFGSLFALISLFGLRRKLMK
ncbi:DUF3466 family protein [Candidatus Colwellia aromaticivorans]|uniref:DUF3466 family protein n=1 Tax=Candidatus Colwellia aromaticivorans TaxID=2267621 RepID=UPI000DF16F10|nr:DUF3466 family protein [Candidatus Colwellia aromaticivorans]